MNALTHPASLIRQSFAALWSKGFQAAHAAEKLGLSEGQAWAAFAPVHADRGQGVSATCGVQPVTWLRADWPALLQGLPTLGRMVLHTRNQAVHVRSVSTCRQVLAPENLAMLLGDGWNARCFLSRWHAAAHVQSEREGVTSHSLRVFDAAGRALCQFTGDDPETHATWLAWVQGMACPAARPVFDRPRAPVWPGVTRSGEPEVDLLSLGDAWGQLPHPRDLPLLLRRHRVGRLQAYRLMEGVHTRRTPLVAVEQVWRLAREIDLPWSLYAGNVGGAVVVRGPLGRVQRDAEVLTLSGESTCIRLRIDPVAESWVVTVPGESGAVHRLELFDDQGGLILGMEGVREPGGSESPAWRLMLLSLSVGARACAARCLGP